VLNTETYHNARFFRLDALHHGYDLLLNGELVEHLTTTEFGGIVRDGNTIQTITDGVILSSTAA
jgi:hypothetical protein